VKLILRFIIVLLTDSIIVLTYIEVSAKAVHISADKAFYLVSIANAASGAGRLGSGFAADRFGPLSVIIPMTALAGVLTYVWPFITSYAGFAVLAVFYGAAAGVFVALIVTPTIALGELRDVGQRIGMYFTILALGALAGPPISGAIERASGGFKAVGFYAGSTVMVAVGVMIVVRRLVLGGWSGKF
jgi:MCP family monocarboxylic acid transporter-like MFS transporter 10